MRAKRHEKLLRVEKLWSELKVKEERVGLSLALSFLRADEVYRILCVGKGFGLSALTWTRICETARLFSGDNKKVKMYRRERQHVDAARLALGSSPGAAFVELRDWLAASARAARPVPPPAVSLVLEASCLLANLPGGSPRAWRTAVDNDKHPKLKLVTVLRRLDLITIFYESEYVSDFRSLVDHNDFPTASEAAQFNVLAGRLAAFCRAAATLYDKMKVSGAFDTVPHPKTAELAEMAAQIYINQRRQSDSPRSSSSSEVKSRKVLFPRPQQKIMQVHTPKNILLLRKRNSLSAPPAAPTLYDIFLHEKQQPLPSNIEKGSFRDSLRLFYQKHNPSLLPRVDTIADEWHGQESTLFALLRYKYNDSSSASQPQDTSQTPQTPQPQRSFGTKSRRSTSALPPRPRTTRGGSCRPTLPNDSSPSTVNALREEISRLKTDVQAAQQRADRAKARAAAAARAADTAQRELKADRDTAHQLRLQSAALRRERDSQHTELNTLKTKLKHHDDPLLKPATQEDTTNLSVEDLALSAVEAAVIDVLLNEAGIEIDFEIEFSPEKNVTSPLHHHHHKSLSLLLNANHHIQEKPLPIIPPPVSSSPPRVMPLVTPEDLFPNHPPPSPHTVSY